MVDSADGELSVLKFKRGQIKSQMTRFKTFLSNFDAHSDVLDLEVRLQTLERGTLEEFNDIQSKIEALQNQIIQDDERNTFENTYFKTIAYAKRIISNRNKPTPSTNSTQFESDGSVSAGFIADSDSRSRVKLPRLNLPEFHGNYEQWMGFIDTFSSLIDRNTQITEIEKFYYLKSCLKGEAAQMVQSVDISSINYKIVLQMLKDRYENKKLIIHSHVKAIFDLYPVKNESHVQLRKLLDTFNKNVRALAALEQPTDTWDTLLIYLLSSKIRLNK